MLDSETAEFDRWIRSRDAEAFHALVSRHAPMVYATCRRVLGDSTEAEDASQETFEALVKAGHKPGRRLGPWLHRVATNLALKRIRSGQRRARREQIYSEGLNVTEEGAPDDIYNHVDEAVSELPKLMRETIIAHFLQGRTQADIARDLGISPQAVSQRIRHGLNKIAQSLKKHGVTASAAVLTELFSANTMTAAPLPATLLASLGRVALSQVGAARITSGASSLLSAKTGVAVAVAAVTAITGYWVFSSAEHVDEFQTVATTIDGGPEEVLEITPAVDENISDSVEVLEQFILEEANGNPDEPSGIRIDDETENFSGRGFAGYPSLQTVGQDLHALDERGSVAWSMLRQQNTAPLLRLLSHRIRPLLDPSRRFEPVWVGSESGASVEITIEFEGDIESEVIVGFFKDANWSDEPEHIRSFKGPGTYTIDTLPEGSFVLGAITEKKSTRQESTPFARGVNESWPQPIRVQVGSTTQVRVLVTEAFHFANRYYGHRMSSQMDGIWEPVDPDNLLQGTVTDPAGQPITLGQVSIREHNPGAPSVAASNLGIGPDGWYFFDGIKWPYKVYAHWEETNVFQFSYRGQSIHHEEILEGPNLVHLQFDAFPAGTAILSGSALDQTGAPVRNVVVDLRTQSTPESTPSVWYRFPFMNEEGTFEIQNLPSGNYKVMVIPFDRVTYQLLSDQVEVTLHDGETSEVKLEVQRKEFFYGRILFSDKRPANPDQTLWPELRTVVRYEPIPRQGLAGALLKTGELDIDGHFAIDLTEHQIESLKSGTGRLRIDFPNPEDDDTLTYESLGDFPFDSLATTREEAGTVFIQ